LRRICIIGAECTGKTTLAQALALHFNGRYVPEALRQFCDRHRRTPTQAEQMGLIDAQLAQEDQVELLGGPPGQGLLFCDTAPLLTAVYSQHYFADHSLYERARSLHPRYSLTLLLEPDLLWAADGFQRDGPSAQTQIHTLLLQALLSVDNVVPVGGRGHFRAQAAIRAMERWLAQTN
jgi:nicotinamide riboside kinase